MPRAIAHNDDIEACGLTYSELQELWLGPRNGGSVFETAEQLRDAWARGRTVAMRLWARGGRRPQGWWQLDPEAEKFEYPGYSRERSYLYERNVLSQQERSELEREWREAFDVARGKDAQERRADFEHHDIPHELIEAWTAARKRRRQQAAASQEEAAAK